MTREKVATRTDGDESISSPVVNDCSVEHPGIATTAPPQGAESSSTHRPNEDSHDVAGELREELEMAGCQKVYRTPSGPNPGAQQALTNVVMTVEYDGSEYNGFVGPNHFYNDERLAMTAENLNTESQRHTSANKSVSNEVLRAIAVIHGYIPNRRKRKKQTTAVNVDEEAVYDVDDDVCTYTLPAERRFTLVASSRTDKGVHATETACQYISFDREPPFNGDLDAFMDRVNRILPEDIRVTAMIAAPKPEFNVRFDNIGKCYTYKVDLSECPSLFERKHHWQIVADSQFRNTLLKSRFIFHSTGKHIREEYNEVREQFSFDRVREAADVIQGTHNFEGFRKKSRGNEKMITKNPICTIHRIDIQRNDTEVGQNKFQFVIHGDRFLYKMVGYGVLKVDDIRLMLERGEAIPDIPYAPSNGLYLTKVKFQPGVEAAIAESKERRCQRLRSLLKPLVEHRGNTLC
ncbi:RNA pseudouridine synthase A 2, putative [Babesia bigemina]|uniref:tRNA pseudouridine synthase n=1 Tax=Babesia bigemina TaxID=5866 RepID=A0A061D538_BABBI|nr:RNA pseudouridine synthase A 2, putative [Babesia bigemina]CDR95162.1 RNA pseudouridine synthase A 2, putative [Babesia bigemina]|eukprot:XP_012767348.1 RNA pseudouridine synthase A 2, putative [Babesia bigemina]